MLELSSEQWALIGAVVGAIIGGFAQVLAGLVADWRSERRQRYQQRRDAYLDFITAIDHEVNYQQRGHLLKANGKSEQLAPVVESYVEATLRRYDALNRITLHAPEDVQERAWGISLIANRPEIDVVELYRAVFALLEVMRADLGSKGNLHVPESFRQPQ